MPFPLFSFVPTIIAFLNVHKIELWNTGGKPKYWTVLFFTSDEKDFPERVSKVMVTKDKILKYQIGNQEEKDFVCSECEHCISKL